MKDCEGWQLTPLLLTPMWKNQFIENTTESAFYLRFKKIKVYSVLSLGLKLCLENRDSKCTITATSYFVTQPAFKNRQFCSDAIFVVVVTPADCTISRSFRKTSANRFLHSERNCSIQRARYPFVPSRSFSSTQRNPPPLYPCMSVHSSVRPASHLPFHYSSIRPISHSICLHSAMSEWSLLTVTGAGL